MYIKWGVEGGCKLEDIHVKVYQMGGEGRGGAFELFARDSLNPGLMEAMQL